MLQQHWRFEEYEWGMVLDDVRLRPVLHVVVVVPAAGSSLAASSTFWPIRRPHYWIAAARSIISIRNRLLPPVDRTVPS